MDLLINGKTTMDDLLNRVGIKLQLNKTRVEKVETSYKAVGDYLMEDSSITNGSDTKIYPQGSYAIETTVKPIDNGEYDLDFVFKIKQVWNSNMNAEELLRKLAERLNSNGLYKGKVILKNRCVRINYDDDFHMDILPAYPIDSIESEYLKIPDRKLGDWVDTSPKLYADWFNDITVQYEQKLFEAKAEQEELPTPKPYDSKPPLKIAIQLIKRYRDNYFKDKEESLVTPSIIITTLAAYGYKKQSSEFQTLQDTVNYIMDKIKNSYGIIVVENPQNTDERFSDKLEKHPAMYSEFKSFIYSLHGKLEILKNCKDTTEVYKTLYEMFGENVVSSAIFEQADYIKNRDNKSGNIITRTTSDKPIEKNTFFGD